MPAKEIRQIEKLGMIAGSGALPETLARACEGKGIKPFIVAFRGSTDTQVTQGRAHIWARAGGAGHIMKTLKQQGIHDIVMIGGMYRPKLWQMIPDWTTLRFFLFHGGLLSGGDNDFLLRLRKFIEGHGFKIHGIQAFAPEVLMPVGILGKHQPTAQQKHDIAFGIEHSQIIGAYDIGQSVAVCEGVIIGQEDKAGTAALIARCGAYKAKGAILVKTAKPHQDRDLDLPTIGPDTITAVADAGFSGVAVHAGAALIAEREKVIELADERGIFVVGVDI